MRGAELLLVTLLVLSVPLAEADDGAQVGGAEAPGPPPGFILVLGGTYVFGDAGVEMQETTATTLLEALGGLAHESVPSRPPGV